jgi:hypothetical protein
MARAAQPCKLSRPELKEFARRYNAGESMRSLQRNFGIGSREFYRVKAALEAAGIAVTWRDAGAATRLRFGIGIETDLGEVSAERWQELYWGPDSGYPSTAALGERFGVSDQTICGYLRRAGISIRSREEQLHIEFRAGRIRPPKGRAYPEGLVGGHRYWKGKRLTKERREKNSASQRCRIGFHCAWCGAPGEKRPAEVGPRNYCNRSCAAYHRNWRRAHGDQAPRPLIVEQLRELMRGRPQTLETAERFAAEIGAAEPEIWAALEPE